MHNFKLGTRIFIHVILFILSHFKQLCCWKFCENLFFFYSHVLLEVTSSILTPFVHKIKKNIENHSKQKWTKIYELKLQKILNARCKSVSFMN